MSANGEFECIANLTRIDALCESNDERSKWGRGRVNTESKAVIVIAIVGLRAIKAHICVQYIVDALLHADYLMGKRPRAY